MIEHINRNLNRAGYCKSKIRLSSEEYISASLLCEDIITGGSYKHACVFSGNSTCDYEIPSSKVYCLYSEEKGLDPFSGKVDLFMSEIIKSENIKTFEVFLIFQDEMIEICFKQRWHRDFEDGDFPHGIPYLIYLPLNQFELGIMPYSHQLPRLSSQRHMTIEKGEAMILRGQTPHRECAYPGSRCLLYYYEKRRPSVMYSVQFEQYMCKHCTELFSSKKRRNYHEIKCANGVVKVAHI